MMMVTKMPWQVALFGSRAGPAYVRYNAQTENLKGTQQSKQMLKDIANRKIEGTHIQAYPAAWVTWTPSGDVKAYQFTLQPTKWLWDGTLATLSEGIGVVDANFKGSFFEAYSAQKFSVFFTPFFCDKDDIQAASEAAWAEMTSPSSYLLAHHTDVINVGKTQSISARVVAGSLWYVKFQTGKLLNSCFKNYLKQVGTVRDSAKLNSEPMEGYVEIMITAGNNTVITYAHRWSAEIITAQADLGII
jgi:hypothetical protein